MVLEKKHIIKKVVSERFDLNKFKIDLAKLFASQISEELEKSIIVDGVHRGDIDPRSKENEQLVEKIRPFSDAIKKISKDFYVVTNKEDKK
jgi:hypothetical protein